MENTEKAKPTNPLLDRLRIPGETFRLPSQGVFYSNGELSADTRNGEVEVYPMTAIDEIILSTPDKLLSGKAIEEVFARCVPQVVKPRDLLTHDVDFLMACLRLVSFGSSMTVNHRHTCENAKERSYVVDLQSVIVKTKQFDPTLIKTDYEVVMDNGQVAHLKPLTFGNVISLYESTLMMKKKDDDTLSEEDMKNIIVNTLSGVVASVDDVTDRKLIVEWLSSIPLGWKRKLEQAAQNTSKWGVDFKIKRKCEDCGQEFEMLISTNPVSFFM